MRDGMSLMKPANGEPVRTWHGRAELLVGFAAGPAPVLVEDTATVEVTARAKILAWPMGVRKGITNQSRTSRDTSSALRAGRELGGDIRIECVTGETDTHRMAPLLAAGSSRFR